MTLSLSCHYFDPNGQPVDYKDANHSQARLWCDSCGEVLIEGPDVTIARWTIASATNGRTHVTATDNGATIHLCADPAELVSAVIDSWGRADSGFTPAY